MRHHADLPPHLSYSAASNWYDCNKKWHAIYVLRFPDPSGPEAEIGTMAHRVLQALGHVRPGLRTPQLAALLAARHWAKLDADRAARRAALAHVIRGLRNLDVAQGEVVFAEADLLIPLGGVPFKGYVDLGLGLPSGALHIFDYKTGKHPGRRDWLADKVPQLMLYAAAIEEVYGRPVHEASFIWTANGRVDDFDVTHDSVAAAVGWLRRAWEGIEESLRTDEWAASPGPLCSWCPAVLTCPEGREAVLARAADPSKSIGASGLPIVQHWAEAGLNEQLALSIAVNERTHLHVVPEP